MVIIYINNTQMPSPTSYSVKLIDIDSANSGRGDTGYLTRERLRSDVAGIDVGWSFLTTAELNTVKAAISASSFPVRFYVGGTGSAAYKSATMYAGDRQIELAGTTNGEERWNISFPLTEL